jgi:hypothetical protein
VPILVFLGLVAKALMAVSEAEEAESLLVGAAALMRSARVTGLSVIPSDAAQAVLGECANIGSNG